MTRPFAEQGFHEITFRIWPYVDPIWHDVIRLVSRGWNADPLKIPRIPGSCGPLDIVRMDSVLVVRNENADLYVRAGKRMRVYGPDIKCIGNDRGEHTYVRSTHRFGLGSAFFRVDRGRVLKVNFRSR